MRRLIAGLLLFLLPTVILAQVINPSGGSAPAFSAITTGSNTIAAMTLGNGSSLLSTGTGLVALSGQVNISGPDATTNVEIGATANNANGGTGGTAVVIGNGASNSGNGGSTVTIGSFAVTSATGASNVNIGASSVLSGAAVANAVNVGQGNALSGSRSIALGSALVNTIGDTLLIGLSINSSSGPMVAGDVVIANPNVAGSKGYDNVYFSRGKTNATVTPLTFHGTGGSPGSTDLPGGAVILAGGIGTGAGAGGNVGSQTAPALATGSTSSVLSDRGLVVAKAKALTESSATAFVQISLPALSMAGGSIDYSIQATDGTDMQSLSGTLQFSVVNKATVETCTISTPSTATETLVATSAAGTLANTFACDTSPTNGVTITANAVSSLVQTVLQIVYQVRLNGAVGTTTITPQ